MEKTQLCHTLTVTCQVRLVGGGFCCEAPTQGTGRL